MVEVVVAGGGPVGMFLAAELRLSGVGVVVLERSPEPTSHSRAFRLQPRTLDILDARGLLERFKDDHLDWPNAHFAGLKPLLDLGRTGGEHGYSLLIPQTHTERLLEEHARALGAEIRRGHELIGFEQDADQVGVRVRSPGKEYVIAARFLAGCDGGRSTVRKLSGLAFTGAAGRVTALLGDVTLHDPGKLPSGIPGTLRTPRGLLMAVALEPGVTRVVTTEFDRPRANPDAPVTLDELRSSVHRITGEDVGLSAPRWLSHFTDAARLADSYRDRRVLLAGDAAHVHFPIGAQGLNLGLQDAANLGWKLAAEVRGWAPAMLLGTYDQERRPVARAVLREIQAQLVLMRPDDAMNPLRELFGELLALDAVNTFLSRMVGGTDVRYDFGSESDSQLVGRFAPSCTVRTHDGDIRLAELLRAGRAVAVLHEGFPGLSELRARWAGRVDVVAATACRPETRGLLLRPDGHVAWAMTEQDDEQAAAVSLRQAMASWFGAPSRTAVPVSGF
jgi:2-polyprenyl-6-methoxyphenol hydroxylase-like FAD-dependent oxidoreductase